MLKNVKLLWIVFIGLLLLSGCGVDSIKVHNPLTETEIVSYVEQEIYKETGDKVTATIISKENLTVCTAFFDGCVRSQTVDGGHSYKLEIVNVDNRDIAATGTYRDGYIMYDDKYTDGKSEKEPHFNHNYQEQKELFLIENEFINVLNQTFSEYFIYKDVSNNAGYDIFIYSSDYNQINDLLLELNNIVTKYKSDIYTSFSVYIYKDEAVFNSTHFELYNNGAESSSGQSYGKDMIEQYTGKEATRIGGSTGFDYDLFISNGSSASDTYDEYVDYNSFDYLVFWYTSEPNAAYHNGSMQIFGVK